MAERASRFAWLVPAVTTGSLVPFVSLAWRAKTHMLGANPIATALNQLGLLALIFLLASLACTPLKLVFAWTWPVRIRRALGLLAFFSALLHFLVYAVLDQRLALGAIFGDITKRPFIVVGLSALLVLLPLALTSTKRAVSRLGFARWKLLHRLVYLAGVLGCVHFFLRVKSDHTLPLVYMAILSALFLVRVIAAAQRASLRARRSLPRAGSGTA